jgi:beta-glucosidase
MRNDFWQTLAFPADFVFGAAASAFQMEGVETDTVPCVNNWTQSSQVPQAGIACGHWTRYKEDIQLLKNLGITAYRLSIEWSKIEPHKGVFDEKSMQHYSDVVDELLKNGITPIICLFHHTWPAWFDTQEGMRVDSNGKKQHTGRFGFEAKENIEYFVRYAKFVFEHLHTKVKTWMTFNEPEGYAIEAWYRGKYPPHKKNLKLAGIVLKNFLNAHVYVYKIFKNIDPTVQIGFTKVMNPIDPYNPWNPLEQTACSFFSKLLHDATLDFFQTGTFSWAYMVHGKNKSAPDCLDFIGLNYYGHTIIKHTSYLWKLEMSKRSTEQCADSGKIIYPEGLYRCIKRCAQLKKPIYIAENGLADEYGIYRDEYIRKHLFVISKALQKGYDIRGYFYWSPFDTFNWGSAFNSRYGLYAVDFTTYARTLRPSAQPFVTFMRTWQKGNSVYHSTIEGGKSLFKIADPYYVLGASSFKQMVHEFPQTSALALQL